LPLRQLNGSNSARQLIGSNFGKVQTTLKLLTHLILVKTKIIGVFNSNYPSTAGASKFLKLVRQSSAGAMVCPLPCPYPFSATRTEVSLPSSIER